jgi:hypothetical protein
MRTLATLSCLLLFIFAGSGPVLAAEASPSPAPSAAATPLAISPICSLAFAAAENGAPAAAPARLDAAIYISDEARTATYQDWIHQYNHHRPHTGIGGAVPADRVHNLTGNYN